MVAVNFNVLSTVLAIWSFAGTVALCFLLGDHASQIRNLRSRYEDLATVLRDLIDTTIPDLESRIEVLESHHPLCDTCDRPLTHIPVAELLADTIILPNGAKLHEPCYNDAKSLEEVSES